MQFLFLINICLLSCIGTSYGQASCDDVACPEPLDCRFPNQKITLPDPENSCCNITECICEGTEFRFSTSASFRVQYKKLVDRYTNCTLVQGNLEITHIKPLGDEVPYTIEATKHIRSVTGYVSIALNGVHYIDLSSLRLIRGEKLIVERQSAQSVCKRARGTKGYSKGFALLITKNYITEENTGLKGINLKSLTEITRGDVKITDNDDLCFVDTIVWNREILNSDAQVAIVNISNKDCKKCSQSCVADDVDQIPHCWGETDDLCQQYTRLPCSDVCPGLGRCTTTKRHGGRHRRCCSSNCAGGCAGSKCYFCHALNNFGDCVRGCPAGFVRSLDGSVTSINVDDVRYEYNRYCVKECPPNLRILDTGFSKSCVTTCPHDYYEVKGRCERCPSGGCGHICYGLGVGIGPLKDDDAINSQNIGHFTKNCTIIEGSLIFRSYTFRGDLHCAVPGMSEKMLDVFENVEEITGYLSIESWPRRDLCVFKNLRRIRGLQKRNRRYSLVVMTSDRNLEEMCLNSLEEISSGGVAIAYNSGLCHAEQVKWDAIFTSPEQATSFRNNAGKQTCTRCHETCNEQYGCWGPGSDQCVSCKNYTDYTNSSGQFASKWIVDSVTGEPVPGHNVTTCVSECDHLKGVYATEDFKCYPCDEQCDSTCSGPGPANCTSLQRSSHHGCKNFYHNGACVKRCPDTHTPDGENKCVSCSAICQDGGCSTVAAVWERWLLCVSWNHNRKWKHE